MIIWEISALDTILTNLTNLTKYPRWRPHKRRLQGFCIGGIAIPTRPNLTFQAILKQSDLERGEARPSWTNGGFRCFHCSKQIESFLLVLNEPNRIFRIFTPWDPPDPANVKEICFLVKGLMTKSDTMLIGLLVDLQGPKQVFPSCHFTCSNLANW